MTDTYKLFCRKCKQFQNHKVSKLNRTKGVKLECFRCGFLTCYHNLNYLESIENGNKNKTI